MRPVEQLQAQGLFQRLDAACERRLGQVQAQRRLEEGFFLGNDGQVFQSAQIQHIKIFYKTSIFLQLFLFTQASKLIPAQASNPAGVIDKNQRRPP
jgi:hypothetical protein